MTLEQWDIQVRPHLHFIEAGAEMIARHTRFLMVKPEFETIAQGELQEARKVLEKALALVITAQASYSAKLVERNDAA